MLSKKRQQEIFAMKTLAYISACGGLEIKKVEYGIETRMLVVANAWGGKKSAHEVTIKSNKKGESYFKLFGTRYHLNECIKC